MAIVLRTRDRPVLLARALGSILAQAHDDWQLVLVNDGGARAPVDALAATYASAFGTRLTLLHAEPATGPDGAVARALDLPVVRDAAFVALHDDDDAWHPDFLRDGLAVLTGPGGNGFVGVACHEWQVEERLEDGGIVEERRQAGFSAPHPVELARTFDGAPMPLICLLFRRAALDRMRDAAAGAGLRYGGAGFDTALLLTGEVAVIPRRLGFSYRRSLRAGPYANASGAADVVAERVRHRNDRLRALVAADPALPGLVPALTAALAPDIEAIMARFDRNGGWGHGRHAELQARLIRIEATLDAMRPQTGTQETGTHETGTRKAGTPAPAPRGIARQAVRRGWHRLGRPRRWLARLRGRI